MDAIVLAASATIKSTDSMEERNVSSMTCCKPQALRYSDQANGFQKNKKKFGEDSTPGKFAPATKQQQSGEQKGKKDFKKAKEEIKKKVFFQGFNKRLRRRNL